jgi:hypothetical protein
MKASVPILVIVTLFASPARSAQDSASNDLNTLLRDASYVFNRFDEVSAGVQAQIDTKYPVEVRKSSKAALADVLGNVETEKVALNALLTRAKVSSADLLDLYKVSSADLLDLYTELVEVTSELSGVSYEISDWGDQKLGMDLAQLGAKSNVLGARVAATLRSQIASQELQLVSCTQKAPSHKSE